MRLSSCTVAKIQIPRVELCRLPQAWSIEDRDPALPEPRQACREALEAKLAALDQRAKAAELAARDAGRPTLLAALGKVTISAIGKPTAPLLTSLHPAIAS